jgi:dGTPase
VQEATDKLRAFLFENVYLNPVAKSEEVKAQAMLTELFEYFVKHPEKMPELYTRNLEAEGVRRCVCDYISGMTDRYAIELYNELFIPRMWRGKA